MANSRDDFVKMIEGYRSSGVIEDLHANLALALYDSYETQSPTLVLALEHAMDCFRETKRLGEVTQVLVKK